MKIEPLLITPPFSLATPPFSSFSSITDAITPFSPLVAFSWLMLIIIYAAID
jgi:hypothetical protein